MWLHLNVIPLQSQSPQQKRLNSVNDQKGGWLGFALFFVIVIIFCYTVHLIQQCMDADPSINSYGNIGAAAFGYKGRVAVAFIMYIEMYLTVIGFLIKEGDNLDKFFPNTSIELGSLTIKEKQLFILVAVLIILPTTWLRDLSILAYFSAAGFFSSFIFFGSLLWTGIVDTGFHEKGKAVNLSGLPTTVGLYAICFCGHAVFPTIYSSMTETTRFSKVLLILFSLLVLNCEVVAVFGYHMYGDDTKSQVTLNFPAGKFYSRIAICTTTLVNPFSNYAWALSPIAMPTEECLSSNFDGE